MSTKLSRNRAGHRARVNSLIRYINEEISKSEPNSEDLEGWKEELKRQRDSLVKLDDSILENTEDADVTEEISSASNYAMNINKTIKRVSSWETSKSTATATSNLSKSVKLPNIALGKFSGEHLAWPAFWDLFKASIHDRTDLSGPAKFHYLLSQLEGDAAQLLAGFDHTEQEYEQAVSLLKETYGKPKLLIQARLHAILDIASPEPNSTSLAKYRSAYEGHLRGLQSLGCDIESAGFVFTTILLRKLPKRSFDNINRANKSDVLTLAELRKLISDEIELIQATENAGSSQNCKKQNEEIYEPVNTASFHVSSGQKWTKSMN